jgi:hypothetical protein
VRPRLNTAIPRTLVGEVVEAVHPASAAFVERLQSSLSFARKCLIAAQQRQKALADNQFLLWSKRRLRHLVHAHKGQPTS